MNHSKSFLVVGVPLKALGLAEKRRKPRYNARWVQEAAAMAQALRRAEKARQSAAKRLEWARR